MYGIMINLCVLWRGLSNHGHSSQCSPHGQVSKHVSANADNESLDWFSFCQWITGTPMSPGYRFSCTLVSHGYSNITTVTHARTCCLLQAAPGATHTHIHAAHNLLGQPNTYLSSKPSTPVHFFKLQRAGPLLDS